MSEITRKGLEKISYFLGQSHFAIDSRFGDLNKNPSALLGIEAMLCRLRGSTLFYNDDYSVPKFSIGNVPQNYYFTRFPGADIIDFGVQGAFLSKDYNAKSLPFETSAPSWNPSYFGPPSPEGFGTWYYNAWKGYKKDPPSVNFEGGNYNLRYEQEYPVRYTNNNQTPYVRVAYFEHARWISIFNSGNSARGANDYVYVFTIDKDQLNGFKIRDAETDLPKDLRFMYYNKLLQKHQSGQWQPIEVNTGSNNQLYYLAHQIQENQNSYTIKVNIPNDLIFDPANNQGDGNNHQPSTWWHFVMYWGSKDPKVLLDEVSFDNSAPEYVLNSNEFIVWNVKHFFNDEIHSKMFWEDFSINDSSTYNLSSDSKRYLISKNRVHLLRSDPEVKNYLSILEQNPYKYSINTNFLTALSNFSNNSISNYVTNLKNDEYQSAILMVYTFDYNFVEKPPFDYSTIPNYIGQTSFKIKLGPKFSSDEATSDWENFQYFPEPDVDYVTFARLILKRADERNYGSVEAVFANNTLSGRFDALQSNQVAILHNVQIIWIQQMPPSFAIKPHGDPLIASILVPALHRAVSNLRYNSKQIPINSSAAKILLLASRTPAAIADSQTALLNPNSFGSIIFRRLLKNPVDVLLQPDTDQSLAIQFTSEERKYFEEMNGLPPSTEMLRLNSDSLILLNNKLNIANAFEIYHEPSDQCTAADNQTTGTRVGLDYTFRLFLEDQDENVLRKDWYIMASKYLLSQEEYNNRIEKQQTTVGYFTFDRLNSIREWKLQGYRSIVPDLNMGESRVIINRYLNPFDSEAIYLSKFRQDLAAQGFDEDYINEAVLVFLEDGGVFADEPNLSQYDNKFTTIREAALNITTFTEGIPVWKSNIKNFFSFNEQNPSGSLSDFYSDSFTLALAGSSGSVFEAYGKQSLTIHSFTPTSSLVDLTLHFNSYAFSFTSSSSAERMTTVGMKLKVDLFDADSLLLSNDGSITASIYSSTIPSDVGQTVKPNLLLAVSTNSVGYKELENGNYKEFYWTFDFVLNPATTYWVVLTLDSIPVGGDIKVQTQQNLQTKTAARLQSFQAFSFTNNSNTNTFSCSIPIRILPNTTNTTGQLENASGALEIKIYSANEDGTLGEELNYTSSNDTINFSQLSSTEKNFNFDATFNFIENTKYWVVLIPNTRPRGGTISVNLNSVTMNPFSYTLNTADGNNYTNWDLFVNEGTNYRAWMVVHKIIPEIYGYFNRHEDYLEGYLPGANANRIANTFLKIEGSWAFTIKKFPQPSVLYIYPRYLTNFNGYVKYFNDIYVHLRLIVGGSIKDYRIKLKTTDPVAPRAVNNINELADGIAYMYVTNVEKELDNGYHGAPASDRLVIRSS